MRDRNLARTPNAPTVSDVEPALAGGLVSAIGRGSKAWKIDPNLFRIVAAVDKALPRARERISARMIEQLVEVFAETHDPVAAINADINAENARARIAFVAQFPTLTSEQIAEAAGSSARNRSQTATRWKADGKIFSIPWRGQERYPAFQFKDGQPLAVIADVLAALPDAMSPWETAYWFVSTNGWLDGAAPLDRLGKPELVAAAARCEAEAIAG